MKEKRSFLDYFIITLKGMAMGAADVVPGVSGGTIAFISGIYEELLDTINAFKLSLIPVLKNKGIKAAWQKANLNFLVALLLGIGISVLSLAKLLSWLLLHKPVLIWSFFFGLVIASIWFVGKQIKVWNIRSIFSLITGIISAYLITTFQPVQSTDPEYLYLFLSGALAITAMILPGISGAFILVLLGVYQVVLNAVHEFNFKIIAIVGVGAVVGLLSFSRVLKYFLSHYKSATLALLTGFIIGALTKIWPWKVAIENSFTNEKPVLLTEKNVWPTQYDGDPQILWAIILGFAGFLLILALEKWGQKST